MPNGYTGTLGNVFQSFQNIGLQDLWLPFALIFVLSYVALQKSGVLGDSKDAKKYNLAIAIVISLLVVIPHVTRTYPAGADPIDIINNAIPNVAVILVVIVMFLILIGLFGGKAGWTGSLAGFIVLASAVAIGWIFLRAAGYLQYGGAVLNFLDNPETQALIIIILVFGLIVYFITKEPREGEHGGALSGFFNALREGFGGGGGGHH
ncbi:hypothetical protein J4457_02645 [Candidatus Woesearchaeota archaeon]|nr:hypothetical protein [Candidatus Woesearchaeota archaeon]